MLQLTTIFFLITASLWAAIHYIAMRLFLYWSIEWLDIPMHFIGGTVIALGVFTLRDLRIVRVSFLSLAHVLLIVLLLALIWEAYEYIFNIPMTLADGFYVDTAFDLVLGLAGGWVGYYVGKRLRSL